MGIVISIRPQEAKPKKDRFAHIPTVEDYKQMIITGKIGNQKLKNHGSTHKSS